MATGFNLTANLMFKVDQASLNSAITNIKNAVSKASGTINIGISSKSLAQINTLNDKLKSIKTTVKSGLGKIEVKIGGDIAKQIKNVDLLGKKLKNLQGISINPLVNIDTSLNAKLREMASSIEILGKASKKLNSSFGATTSTVEKFSQNVDVLLGGQKLKEVKTELDLIYQGSKSLTPAINTTSSSIGGFSQSIDTLLGGGKLNKVASGLELLSIESKSLGSSINTAASSIGNLSQNVDNMLTGQMTRLEKLKRLREEASSLGVLPGRPITQTSIDQTKAVAPVDTLLGSSGRSVSGLDRLREAGYTLGVLNSANEDLRKSIDRTSSSVKNFAGNIHQATSFMYEFGKSGALALKRFGAFTVATSIVFGLVYAIKDAFKEAIEFEKQLAKIAQVSGTVITGVKGISDEITKLSIKYGTASKELIGIAQIFAQAGLKGYELQKALDAVAKSDLAPTFTDMTNTGEGLISMMGQFKIKADDYERVLGSINQVSAEFAVESDDLITAIRVFGGVFANASQKTKGGVRQLQEMIALFTSLRDTSRESAESISTGLRTIITRIQRPRTIKFLKEGYNIELEDAENNFIGIWEAINKLTEGTKDLNTASESYRRLAEELGGYRQINKTLGALQQQEKRVKALAAAERGELSLNEQMDVQLGTLSRSIVKVAEDFKRLIREIVASDTFKTIAQFALNAATAFIKLADAIRPVLPLLAGLLAIRGTMAAFQFSKGFIHQMAHTGGAFGAGISAVQKGGITGFGGMDGSVMTSWDRFRKEWKGETGGIDVATGAKELDTKGKYKRRMGAVGRLVASNSMGLMAGGMIVESISDAYGGNQVATGISRTVTGAGIGGMIGGPWGVAVGAVVGAMTAVADALGPEKIRKANETLAKELERVGQRFIDFDKIKIDEPGFAISVADLASEINRQTDFIQKNRLDNGVLTYAANNRGSVLKEGLSAIMNNKWTRAFQGVTTFGLSEMITRPLINWAISSPKENEQIKEINLESRNRAVSNLQSGLTSMSLKEVEKFKKIVEIEGNIFTEDGRLTDKGKELQKNRKYGDLRNYLVGAQYGSSDTEENIRFMERVQRGEVSDQSREDQGRKNLIAAQAAGNLARELKLLTYAFDRLRLSMSDLKDRISDVIDKNQMLAETTNKYYERAFGGPSSTRIIAKTRLNIFKNPGAYSPEQLFNEAQSIGLGGKSPVARTIFQARKIEQLLPQILEQSKGGFVTGNNLRKSLFNITTGAGGVFEGFDKTVKDNIEALIDGLFAQEGNVFTLKQDIDSKKLLDDISQKILGDINKESLETASSAIELINNRLQRIAELAEKELELEQKLLEGRLQLLNQSQEFSSRRANLFYTESPQAEQSRIQSNRSQQIATIMGGQAFKPFDQLFRDRDIFEQSGMIEELKNTQSAINKQIEVAKLLTDVEKDLANIEKQVLDEQRKREQGRNIIEYLVNASPMDKAKLMQGIRAAVTGQGLNNRFEAQNALEAIKTLQRFDVGGNFNRNLEQGIVAPLFGQLGRNLGGQGFNFIDIAGTARGQNLEEQRLGRQFNARVGQAQAAGRTLQEINERQGRQAVGVGNQELVANLNNVKSAQILAQDVKITPFQQAVQNVGVFGAGPGVQMNGRPPGFASGTPLVTRSGLAQIHKGEAIIPAKAVSNNNQGIQARSNIDEALIKAANALAGINIPSKITIEIGTLQHQINFNGNDILAQHVAKQVAEMAGAMVQKQLKSVISPVSGEVLVG